MQQPSLNDPYGGSGITGGTYRSQGGGDFSSATKVLDFVV